MNSYYMMSSPVAMIATGVVGYRLGGLFIVLSAILLVTLGAVLARLTWRRGRGVSAR